MTTNSLIADVPSLRDAEEVLRSQPKVLVCRIALAEFSDSISLLMAEMIRTSLSSFIKDEDHKGIESGAMHAFDNAFRDCEQDLRWGGHLPFEFEKVHKKGNRALWLKPNFTFGTGLDGQDIMSDPTPRRLKTIMLQSNSNDRGPIGKHQDKGYLTFCFYMQGRGLTYYNPDGETVLWDQRQEMDKAFISVHRGEKHPAAGWLNQGAAWHTGHGHMGMVRASTSFTYMGPAQ